MIVAIEGTSAAGKTSWCNAHAGEVVVAEAERSGPVRWRHALELERRHGIAVCDGDPAKLYYGYALWKTGRLDDRGWHAEQAEARASFEAGELGLADLVCFAERDVATLVRHRVGDLGRRRRRFWLHVELQPWFKRWWEAVDAVEPGRVRWRYPDSLDDLRNAAPRARRTGGDLLDQVLAQLV